MSSIFDSLNDDGKLKQRFFNKRVNAAKEGIEFQLTPKEFMALLLEAGVTSSKLGVKGYHLARYKDSGPYAYGNCRFVWYLDNLKEKWGRLGHKQIPQGMSWDEYCRKRQRRAARRQAQRAARLNPSYSGSRNSQFGTFWITNGRKNKKVSLGTRIPKGFVAGRSM